MAKIDLALKKEIKSFVEKNIKDVKCVGDIISIGNFHLSVPMDIPNLRNYYDHLSILKKLLQITLNIFYDFELYKDFDFKLWDESKVTGWQSYYKLDVNNCVWRCTNQPSKDDLIEIFYEYVFCFLSIQKYENSNSRANHSEKNKPYRCTICELVIPSGAEKCDGCETSVCDMETNIPAKNNLEDKKIDGRNISVNEVKDKIKEEDNIIESYHEKPVEKIVDKNLGEQKISKWKCGKCECLNAYSSKFCDACYEDIKCGVWTCKECTMENSCGDGRCTACGARNINIEVEEHRDGRRTTADNEDGNRRAVDEDRPSTSYAGNQKNQVVTVVQLPVGYKKNEWRCDKCTVSQAYGGTKCSLCPAVMKDSGSWACESCASVNKCLNNTCANTHCASINVHLPKNKNKKESVAANTGKTKKESVGGETEKTKNEKSSEWKCGNSNCRSLNKPKDGYCSQCGLQRDFSLTRGDLVSKMSKKTVIQVWLCHLCHKCNPVAANCCEGKGCKETRYEKWK